MSGLDGGILQSAVEFDARLAGVRAGLTVPFPWYPYGSLYNAEHIHRLLGGSLQRLRDLAGKDPVLDVCCADGDLTFFLESLGAAVHAVDLATTNHNGMRGVHALKDALGSQATIREIDLDQYFDLPLQHYGLTVFLGALYHLKNPFYVLERLAKCSRYCLMSTRIMNRVPPALPKAGTLPIGYLLDSDECNRDDSNYWIFTESAVRRLLRRTHWRVLESFTAGAELADPWSLDGDQRMFCLIESTYGLFNAGAAELLEGWYAPEQSSWRWTDVRFSARLNAPPNGREAVLSLSFLVHEVLLRDGPVTLSASLDGVELEPQVFTASGSHRYIRPLPAALLGERAVTARFELSRGISPSASDPRSLGLVVGWLGFDTA